MGDLSKRLREAAIHRETVTPDEYGMRTLSASLDLAKVLMAKAADALEWQPIADVTGKGGVDARFLGWNEALGVFPMQRHGINGWVMTDGSKGPHLIDSDDLRPYQVSPTHFMPLPQPPEGE